jgi:hypothetical protein
MAIAYGYRGQAPKHLNWFCTDEDQGSDLKSMATQSPECTKSDATSDPFSFWERRVDRVLDLVLERNSASAPVWKTLEVKSQIEEAVSGLSAYAMSAELTSGSWTNFFGKNGRPDNALQVKDYVLERIKTKVCNSELKDVINSKESAEAQKVAQENLDELKKIVVTKTASLGLYTAQDIGCIE